MSDVPNYGDRLAWTLTAYGKTDGISEIHRVYEEDRAFCGAWIPAPSRHFPMLRSLPICNLCEELYEQSQRESEKVSA